MNRATDIYALGAVLFEMLVGECVFLGDRGSILHQILTSDPRRPRSINRRIPRDLETVCLKALCKEPSGRYPTIQEMEVDLRRFARGDAILARPPSAIERGWRMVRRHPGVSAAALVVVILAAFASSIIGALRERNYFLEGYRPVLITSRPAGANVILVPIDERTGEPTMDLTTAIRPRGVTPLTTKVKPGTYLIEAALAGGGAADGFAEVYRTIVGRKLSEAEKHANRAAGRNEMTLELNDFVIPSTVEPRGDEVAIKFDEAALRHNGLLPETLLVSVDETDMTQLGLSNANLETASRFLERDERRLPSAAEYDAVIATLNSSSGPKPHLRNLFGGLPEWTTTRYFVELTTGQGRQPVFQGAQILKGYNVAENYLDVIRTPHGQLVAPADQPPRSIGIRGVRSAKPRFLTRE